MINGEMAQISDLTGTTCARKKYSSPHFSPGGEMITQGFGFTKDFVKEWNNSVYFRLNKILCGFKDQVRARPSGEKCGLARAMVCAAFAADI
jgi:hypothetical protein